jgi:hypothetical protein
MHLKVPARLKTPKEGIIKGRKKRERRQKKCIIWVCIGSITLRQKKFKRERTTPQASAYGKLNTSEPHTTTTKST